MKSLIRYCKLSHGDRDSSLGPEPTVQFNLKALHQFDAIKVVLEQSLYYRFLYMTDYGTNVHVFRGALTEMFNHVRPHAPYDLVDSILGEYYNECYKLVHSLIGYDYADGRIVIDSSINYHHIIAAFNTDEMVPYRDREYTCTITNDFLRVMLYLIANFVEVEDGGVKPMYPGVIYTPEIKTVQHYHPDVATSRNNDSSMIYVLNPSIQTVSCNFDVDKNAFAGLYHYLAMFDYGDMGVDEMIGILSNYTTGQNQYNIDGRWNMPAACLDIMTRSGDLSNAGMDNPLVAGDARSFMDVLIYLVRDTKRLRSLQDYPLFGMLLASGCMDGTPYTSESIKAYFSKEDPSEISAMEALSFRTSEWATFMSDKLMITLEAPGDDPDMGDDLDEDSLEDMDQDESSEDMDDTTNDMGSELEAETSEADDEPVNDKPQVDPNLMLMELANRYDTMSQLFFRQMVGRRLKSIIDNPPPNLSSSTILLLRRWRSRWLYLASIPSLRDFITRVGVRLSDTKY